MMFLEVKEFALHLYVESRDQKWSRRVKVGGLLWSIFSEPELERLKLKILEPKLHLLNYGSRSWSRKDLFKNCGAGTEAGVT